MIDEQTIGLPIQKYIPNKSKFDDKNSTEKAIEIYNYIASRPAYIRRSGSSYRSELNDKKYIELIENRVRNNQPVELFFLGYCSKYTSENLTNNQIYPDMGNLISFVHLLTISKNLSTIYEPGIKFIVALETDIYRSLGKHTEEETKRVNQILNELLKEAENITGVKGKIELVDTLDLVSQLGDRFTEVLSEEQDKVLQEYKNGEIKEKIDNWVDFYNTTTSEKLFPDKDTANEYALKQAIFYEAFNRVKYNSQDDERFIKNGIAHNYPNAIWTTTRGTKEKATIQIFPKESHFPHHGVCSLGKDGRWRISKYEDLQNIDSYYIPRFHEKYDYPFYFEEISRELPEHDLNSLKCHTKIETMRDGEKVVLKFSNENHEDGTQILAKEIDRIMQMRDAGINLVPEIFYTKRQNMDDVAYAMKYIDGVTLEELLLKNPDMPESEFRSILNEFLNTLNQEMYSKGFEEKAEDYIRNIHGSRINDIKENDVLKIKSINGNQVLSPTEMVEYLEEQYNLLDEMLTSGIVPKFTHGDLHFRNIMFDSHLNKFKTIDINGRRAVNTVETEMSRLLLSFDAYLIRNNLIKVNQNDGNLDIEYSDEAKRIMKLRDIALNTILENSEISKWFVNKESAIAQMKLLEAVHILGVHNKRKGEQQLTTYTLGTQLMNEAIKDIQMLQKENQIDNSNEVLTDMLKRLNLDQENKELYKQIYAEYMEKLSQKYQDFAFISHGGTWYIRLTDKEGNKIVKGLREDILDIDKTLVSNTLVEYSDDDFMKAWQKTNFPSNGEECITKSYSEKKLWNSMFSGVPVKIGESEYVIEDIVGIGKESKAFKTKSGEIIKIGLQYLKPEYDYGKNLEQTCYHDKFPQYYGIDEENNLLVMELCEGETANELIRMAKTPEEKIKIIRVIFDSIKTECGLYNNHGIITGQFNLRNVIVDDDKFKIIDPFYEGTEELYQSKQLCRMSAILPQRLYKNDECVGDYPLRVKKANTIEQIKELRYPKEAIKVIDETKLGFPKTLEEEMKQFLKKYLSGDITKWSLKDMEKDAAYLYGLSTIINHKMEQSKTGVVFDINGTIEHDGEYSQNTVDAINSLIKRGIPVACITGKNRERAIKILEDMGIDTEKINLYTQNGAVCYNGKNVIYEEKLSDFARKTAKIMLPKVSSDDILIREDDTRVNILFQNSENAKETIERLKNVRGIEIVTSNNGAEVEVLSKGVNKDKALQHFACANNMTEQDIIRIGNEPQGNDNTILNTVNSLIIEGKNQGDGIFKSIDKNLSSGGIQISPDIPVNEKITLRDFEYVDSEQLEYLSEYAQSVAKPFYPAFAIKQRLSLNDEKRLDYKWAICDGNKPVGFTFAYEIDKSGMYNIGMYMLPEYTSQGIGPQNMNAIFNFCSQNVENFEGVRVRIAETNEKTMKMLEKCGFIRTRSMENDYTLFDKDGNKYAENTIVYERNNNSLQKSMKAERKEDVQER